MLNAHERMANRMKGEPVDRLPNFNILMTFAAQYIGQPLSRYYLDYKVLVEANLAMVEDFGLDIVQAISDPYREATWFGMQVEFPHDGLPLGKTPLLQEPDDLKTLKAPDPTVSPRMLDRLEAIRLFREKVGGDIPIMGWVEGAMAEAADIRGDSAILLDLYDRPEWMEELLEICTETSIAFARAQIEAGADIIGMGDAITSQISPAMFRKYALPYEQRIFEAVHEMGAVARLHICGNTSKIVNEMRESGADIIDLDWMVDWATAADQIGSEVSLLGNFDPVSVMMQGTTEDVYEATIECARLGGQRCFPAAGCEIPAATPHQNLKAYAQALRDD